jgi:Fur family zinc uptake transcriptional regulator
MTPEPVAFCAHDHGTCRSAALAAVDAACAERGLRLTPVRRQVLEILLEAHRAIGAYDVLRRLTAAGATPQPPVAYRALDFLVANGFAHRVEKLNAYVACVAPANTGHAAAFLICRSCGAVAELDAAALAARLGAIAGEAGFAMDRAMLEIEGQCPACQAAAA